jgi:hypothetical protein
LWMDLQSREIYRCAVFPNTKLCVMVALGFP